jgi:hypothetical protein
VPQDRGPAPPALAVLRRQVARDEHLEEPVARSEFRATDRARGVRRPGEAVTVGGAPKQRLLASAGDHLGHQATSEAGRGTFLYDGINRLAPHWPATNCAMTQEDEMRREANPQVDQHLMATPQVAEWASGTLSRWRHGFKSRWDYQRKAPCQATSPDPIVWLNRYSNAEYPASPRRYGPGGSPSTRTKARHPPRVWRTGRGEIGEPGWRQ